MERGQARAHQYPPAAVAPCPASMAHDASSMLPTVYATPAAEAGGGAACYPATAAVPVVVPTVHAQVAPEMGVPMGLPVDSPQDRL